jgi:two-component system sensor histidine kinase UhpB
VVLSYLLLTPTVVLLARSREIAAGTPTRRLEWLMLMLMILLATSIVFGGATGRVALWPVFGVVIPPLLLWAALRFGVIGATGSALIVTIVSTFGTSKGLGPFSFESAADNTLSLQVFMLGTALPLVGLATILAEQRRTMTVLRDTHLRLRGLNRDLVAAREAESTRIARELHDDVGQRLALVSIGLSRLRRAPGLGANGTLGEITRLQEQTSSISRSLRALSHQLHPTALQHAGLVAALQMACDEVGRVTGIDTSLVAEDRATGLSDDVALCLFRVAQEGLNNAVRHASARKICLALRRVDGSLVLTITDDGVGFASGDSHKRPGLGLHSARQRMSLVGGILTIDSAPGSGTTLRAHVPVQESVRA